MSNAVQRLFNSLREYGHNPRKSGTGWYCRCPSHDDRNPSLSINVGDKRVLVNCHAGCTVDAICGAVGLRVTDLFDDAPRQRNGCSSRFLRKGGGDTNTQMARQSSNSVAVASGTALRLTFASAREAVAKLESRHGPRSSIWTYMNAVGEPVGVIVRWDRSTGKDIRPASRNAERLGWVIGGMPTPRPLYQLPDLLATQVNSRVYVCEGEKATDAARAIGLMATTSPHGSKSAGSADWSPLVSRQVVILPDHDDAGEQYADDVTRLAMATGAKSVRVVRLVELWAEMPKGGDMADLLEYRGGNVAPLRAEVETLADKADSIKVTTDTQAIPAYKPFPFEVLPEPIRSFVADGARSIGCDLSYIALPILSGLASAIGNTHRIALKRGWTEPAIVWTAIVGDSGTMKTPAFKLAMNTIRKMQAQAFKENEEAKKEWESQYLRYEAEMTGWKRQAAKGSGDAGDPPDKPTQPIPRRYIVSDTTTEALAPILLGNPRGVLLARDELSGWLGSFDRYAKAGKAGADSAHWLSMHNGEAMTIDRKTGIPPTIHVPSASVSIAGGIQPGILSAAMGQEHHESGLLARLLFAMPPRRAKRWTEADVDTDTEAAVAAVFAKLFALIMDNDHNGDELPRLVTLAPDGKEVWVRFYDEHAKEELNMSGDEAAAWSKLEGYAARLALVIHLARWAAGDATLCDPLRLDEVSVEAGVILARWFGDESRRVYAILSESEEGRESRRLVEWIERKGGSVTVRDLTRGPREFRRNADKAEKALGELVAAGAGKWEIDDHDGGRGRPVDRFLLLPHGGDTGDGDTNSENVEDRDITVTVANHMDADNGWGEM